MYISENKVMGIKQLYIHDCMYLLHFFKSNIFVSLPELKYEVMSHENKIYPFSNTSLFFIPNLLNIYLALIKLPQAEILVHPKLYKNESQSHTFLLFG